MLKIRGEKMLTKERCKLAFEDVEKYSENNIPPLAIDILKRLIEEHFNPQPLKFKDLKRDMWIIDKRTGNIIQVKKIGTNGAFSFKTTDGSVYITSFSKDSFYSVSQPIMEEDK